ncbi:large secreted protein [Cryptosporidium sp. chipmunk genotype I]|uniref:large secreted protein n=1 Tax=Cryptosporidium sp. chipmunk genotype I TaxID=1280935 RepID=UPI00351A5D22|nr:large secreted protein [Cryptosporidium sp. chipmunk genotype I]
MNFTSLYFIFLISLISFPFGYSTFLSKEELWEKIKAESNSGSSSPASKVIKDVVGSCPTDVTRHGAFSRDEMFDLCMSLIKSVIDSCPKPIFHPEYISFTSNGRTVKIPGVRSNTRFITDKLVGKFCRLIISALNVGFGAQPTPYQPTPHPIQNIPYPPPSHPLPQPPYPTPSPTLLPPSPYPTPSPTPLPPSPYPTPSPTPLPPSPYPTPSPTPLPPSPYPTPSPTPLPPSPYPSPLPSRPPSPQGPLGPLHAEWRKIALGAKFGPASRYISSIPESPFPTFMVGKDSNEKVEQCIKAIKEMVNSSMNSNKKSHSGGNLVFIVETISNTMIKVQEQLVLKTSSDDPTHIKDLIKKFCEEVYSVQVRKTETEEWEKIHKSSQRSTIIKKLPTNCPSSYTVLGTDSSSLFGSCVKVLSGLFTRENMKSIIQSSGALSSYVNFSGDYTTSGGSTESFFSSVLCSYPYTQKGVEQAITAFCREIYFGSSSDSYRKDAEFSSIYSIIQTATSQMNSPFGRLPSSPPGFQMPFLSQFSPNRHGSFGHDDLVKICKNLLNLIWENAHTRTPTNSIFVAPQVTGISPRKVVRVGLNWGPGLGDVTINFPFVDTSSGQHVSLESITDEFCKRIFQQQIPLPQTGLNLGPQHLPSPLPQYPTMHPVTHPVAQPVVHPIPQHPVPLADKYLGHRPPQGFPNQISPKGVMLQHPGPLTLSHSRSIWKKLHHHSSFGLGSASIIGIGPQRDVDFLVSTTGEALYDYCFNFLASFYSGGSEYKLSGDGKKLSVKKTVTVDHGKDNEPERRTTQTATLVFMIPSSAQGPSSGNSIIYLIEKFCKSFIEML